MLTVWASSFQLSFQHKVGVLYCKAGQSTEEEMYNNESAGPALEEFLDLLGQRVRLKGFSKYRAQLDNKSRITIQPGALCLTCVHLTSAGLFTSLDSALLSCVPADSTGTHSLYTTYKDYELMFHVSTMLPYTPNNRQQVSRPSTGPPWL